MSVEVIVWIGSVEPVSVDMHELMQKPLDARLFAFGEAILAMEGVEVERAKGVGKNNQYFNQRRLPHAILEKTHLVVRAFAKGEDGFIPNPESIFCGVITPDGEEMDTELTRKTLGTDPAVDPYELLIAEYFESHFNATQAGELPSST